MVINQLVMNQKYLFKLNKMYKHKNIDRRICYNVDELHEI